MVLVVLRHAESVENADKYHGFYRERRPYSGTVAHEISRNVVGLTPRGFRQSLALGASLKRLFGAAPRVYTSTYRRSIDSAFVAFPDLPDGWPRMTPMLDEQHYGDATYMTKEELFATYPEHADDRRSRKHLWVPPGGGESLAGGVWQRVIAFLAHVRPELDDDQAVIAMTHHTTILAMRALIERRALTDVVSEARKAKTPNSVGFRYEFKDGMFADADVISPPEAR
jgi:broad specificity phosphatase PhoE